MLRTFDGAVVRRVVDRSHTLVPEHAHDWPMLSIFIIGSYLNETDFDRQLIASPSVIYYRAGAAHRNTVAAQGFEQLEIEFDPAWIGHSSLPQSATKRWMGGATPALGRYLVELCGGSCNEASLRTALRRFLARDANHGTRPQPWFESVVRQLREDSSLKVADLARSVSRHPAWIGSAYRQVSGEGLPETAARFRVERAAYLLRESQHSCAEIALEAGFCDQSHMNRSFRRVLGRSPAEVREDRHHFRTLSGATGPIL